MEERIYKAGGLGRWAASGLALWLILVGCTIFAIELLSVKFFFGDTRPDLFVFYREIFFLFVIFAFPITMSVIFNWGYERRYNEDIFSPYYQHPDTFFEHMLCVFGGTLLILFGPILGFMGLLILPGLAFM